ncbi:MAG: GFA family protein [Gammaproteobacteria bacterium]|nr:MAG: GFA family protein [Gammaproteobacteria bacterium]
MADDESTARALSGSCLCGRVRLEVRGDLGPADACHCVQCRKQSGHYFASANVPRDALTVTGREHLSWHQSSAAIRRGFCSTCGSFLFWDPPAKDWIAVALGAFDTPTPALSEEVEP